MLTRLAGRGVLLAMVVALSCGTGRAEDRDPPGGHSASKAAAATETPEAAHGGGKGGAGAGLNPITIHHEGENFPGDMALWTVVVFVVVLLILWKMAWRPLADGLTKREQQIADQISQAERTNEEARRLLADYEQKLADSRDEVRGIVEQGRRDAERLGQELIDKAKGEATAERDRAVQQIEAATAGALKELAERSATLAVDLAGKIVGSRLNPKDHTRLIEEAVASFTGKGNGKKK
jgi:F-type H+-transporting ATPase subunit b